MKLSEYVVFAALLTPTLVVAVAAVVSLVAPEAPPEYRAPVTLASNAGRYPADMTTDE
ncbi:MAG: hypothetical protein QOD26_3328 [Betaproteobacteria bacterium]|jgi:hypothetical protein|nr:hypothetical protein [Betaproteobacteria bacterium]